MNRSGTRFRVPFKEPKRKENPLDNVSDAKRLLAQTEGAPPDVRANAVKAVQEKFPDILIERRRP